MIDLATPTGTCADPMCTDAVRLLHDPSSGQLVLDGDGVRTVLSEGVEEPDRWWLAAQARAVVVGDGQQAWLLARGEGGWQGPQPLRASVREARLLPAGSPGS